MKIEMLDDIIQELAQCRCNMKVVDITANEPHKASEVICVKCGHRWYAVRPVDTFLCELHCETCGPGFVIETGEDMRLRDDDRPIDKINRLLKTDPLI